MSTMSKRTIELPINQSTSYRIDDDYLHFTPLGSGQEVGRSCHILTYKNKTIMLDCGIHPAYTGHASLPFFDAYDDLSNIDLLLITHFHLDHSAALPYLLTKTNFNAPVYATYPTKSVYKLILQDYIKVTNLSIDNSIYNENDLNNSFNMITGINYHQLVNHDGIKFYALNAGHVLGAAMFMIEINNINILYTGDYSTKIDRHLNSAEIPNLYGKQLDVLIIEATYGVKTLQPIQEREHRFTSLVSHTVLQKKGKVLLPSFALGRAQEILLILEEYWSLHVDIQKIPIYFVSNLAKKVLSVYQTYINMMNKDIQRKANITNPFQFKHIRSIKNGIESINQHFPCVLMASPGMLQNGLSREILELWCNNAHNAVILTGYSVEGTLAKHILTEPNDIISLSGEKLQFNCSVNYVSFSAHADYNETKTFIEKVQPKHIILVHGEAVEGTGRLCDTLNNIYNSEKQTVTIVAPKNIQTISLQFHHSIKVKLNGKLAKLINQPNIQVNGLLVKNNFNFDLISSDEINEISPIKQSTLHQKQVIYYDQSITILKYCIAQMYDIDDNGDIDQYNIQLDTNDKQEYFIVCSTVCIVCNTTQNSLALYWTTNPINDIIVDSIISIIMNVTCNPATAKLIGQTKCNHNRSNDSNNNDNNKQHNHNHQHDHNHTHNDLDIVTYLKEHYDGIRQINDHTIEVHVDNNIATIDIQSMGITCNVLYLTNRIKKILARANWVLKPISQQMIQQDKLLAAP